MPVGGSFPFKISFGEYTYSDTEVSAALLIAQLLSAWFINNGDVLSDYTQGGNIIRYLHNQMTDELKETIKSDMFFVANNFVPDVEVIDIKIFSKEEYLKKSLDAQSRHVEFINQLSSGTFIFDIFINVIGVEDKIEFLATALGQFAFV